MNEVSRLKNQISSRLEASPPERQRKPSSRLPGRQGRAFYSIITLLITSLLTLLFYFLLLLFSIQPADIALVYGLGSLCLFACLHPWLELFLEWRFHPERFLYHQWVEDYGW